MEESSNWKKSAEWKAHSGSILKVAWAPSEYGSILASCSFDRSVLIFEEEDSAKGKSWMLRATLVDSPLPVTHLQFAPKHLGLKLATSCEDGHVRIYEANDLVNLSMWTLSHDILLNKDGCNCISWNPSPFSPQSIAVATNKPFFEILEFNENQKKWQSIPLEDFQKSVELPPKLAINEISWAPNLGRSFHLIATACKDKSVNIWKFSFPDKNSSVQNNNNNNNSTPSTTNNTLNTSAQNNPNQEKKREALLEREMRELHDTQVWHVEWNVTGTVLASSGDDGVLLLWSRDFSDNQRKWKCVSRIRRN